MEEGSGPSIGNYKGVMLCNRPFAGVSSAAKKAYNTTRKSAGMVPFLSTGKTCDPLGLNPIRHPPNVVVDRSKKDTALSRHKKFLSDLKKQKEAMQNEFMEQVKVKEERANELREKWKLQREKVVRERRGPNYCARGESKSEGESKLYYGDNQDEGEDPETNHSWGEECKSSSHAEEKCAEERAARKHSLVAKPRWALSEKAVEELEDLEADDLLDFAKGLDIDQFLSDLEVRTALQLAKERVDTLRAEKQVASAETKESDCASVSSGSSGLTKLYEMLGVEQSDQPRSKANFRKLWAERRAARLEANEGKDDDADSISDARSILSNTSVKSIKSIHSARSLAKVIERIAEEDDRLEVIKEEPPLTIEPPRIVHIHEDDRTRLTNKGETYNLAYLHRNPAV